MPTRPARAGAAFVAALACGAVLSTPALAPVHVLRPPTAFGAPAPDNRLTVRGSVVAGAVAVQGRLLDRAGQPIADALVNVNIDDQFSGAATTDATGSWHLRIPVPDTFSVGTHELDAVYIALDTTQSASTTTTVERTRATPTKLTATVARNLPGSRSGNSVTLAKGEAVVVTGRLLTTVGAPVQARPVSMDTGPDSPCSGATRANGTFSATCTVSLPVGRHVVVVSALGGPATDPATATVTLVVTAPTVASPQASPGATSSSAGAEPGDAQPPSPEQALPSATAAPGTPVRRSWRSALPSRRVLEVVGGIVGLLVLLGLVGLLLRGRDTSEDTHFIE